MLTLAQNKKTDYRIVIAKNPAPSVFHAAEELRRFLGEISGANFPIVFDDVPARPKEIVVGQNAHLAALDTGIDIAALGREGIWLKTVGDTLVLAGSDVRGALYAVYELLDEHLGCRWFTAEISKIPHRAVLTLPALDKRFLPPLEFRDPYMLSYGDGAFYSRNRCNAESARLEPFEGGKVTYVRFVHTLDELVSPKTYFAEHPEYFALRYDKDGKNPTRQSGYAQPCLTNPDVLEIAKKNVRKILASRPDADILSVSQNDNYSYCQCDRCKAVDEEEGSHAGTLLRFVNAIAEDIETDYPNVAIDTLAYQYTRKPPKITKPRKNVIVRLCSIECCFGHPLDECSLSGTEGGQGSFTSDLEGWSAISNRLHIWDYTANFAHAIQPFPDFKVLKPNIEYFIRHGVTGIFEEGENSVPEHGELNPLRQYVLAKLLWNPDRDFDTLVNEFLAGYFGMAAPAIRAWYDLLHAGVTEDVHVHIYDSPRQPYLSEEFLDASEPLFDEAERLAEDDEILAQVKKLRLSIRYVRLALTPTDDPNRAEAAERFIEDVRASGIGSYREGTVLADVEPKIRAGTI
ncbi:MAG: DUF4838 domain-containing protein [Clostridiales bacterium]|nr:DUF4838 domain-containing protein [Clostridiales bacterium]